jgi:hypothetical protein
MAFTSYGIWAFWIGTKQCILPTADKNVDKGQNSGNPVGRFNYYLYMVSILFRDNTDVHKFPYCDWLYATRNDGKPRALRLSNNISNTAKNLIEQIKTVY